MMDTLNAKQLIWIRREQAAGKVYLPSCYATGLPIPQQDRKTMQPTSPVSELQTLSYDVTEQIGHLLRKAGQRHTAIFQHYVGDNQLTAIQFVTLCALRDHGPSSQTELVEATAVDQATIRGIIQRLKSRNLIELAPDKDDRRKVIVELTQEGLNLLDRVIPRAHTISELTMGNLNPAERVAIVYLLRKMIDSTLDMSDKE